MQGKPRCGLITNRPLQPIGGSLRATRHAWRTHRKARQKRSFPILSPAEKERIRRQEEAVSPEREVKNIPHHDTKPLQQHVRLTIPFHVCLLVRRPSRGCSPLCRYFCIESANSSCPAAMPQLAAFRTICSFRRTSSYVRAFDICCLIFGQVWEGEGAGSQIRGFLFLTAVKLCRNVSASRCNHRFPQRQKGQGGRGGGLAGSLPLRTNKKARIMRALVVRAISAGAFHPSRICS